MTSVINYLVGSFHNTKEESNAAINSTATFNLNSTALTSTTKDSNSNANANSSTYRNGISSISVDALEEQANESTALLSAAIPNGARKSQSTTTDESFKTALESNNAFDYPEVLSPLNDNDDHHDDDDDFDHDDDNCHPYTLPKKLPPNRPPTVNEFYFSPDNASVQRYYRFTSSALTPIAALHRRPCSTPRTSTSSSTTTTTASASPHSNNNNSGVTGLLRRSAVVPSHGTDASGQWILVSVGGRSGWARKKSQDQPFAGFTPAPTFQATEGWMGNHSFLCQGKVMLGSDAPSLFFTNGLLLLGALMHFGVVLPALMEVEEEPNNNHYHNSNKEEEESAPLKFTSWILLLSPHTVFWASLVLFLTSWIFLWIAACMDPGILPAVSSPIKAPIPNDGIPLGGPVGYRYCATCNIFRPPRSKHCNSCNVCVSKFDQ
jgi:DHHC palmitoyltransferase